MCVRVVHLHNTLFYVSTLLSYRPEVRKTRKQNMGGMRRELARCAALFVNGVSRPDKPVSTKDVWKMVRDHYEDTEFDLRKGLASGQQSSTSPSCGTRMTRQRHNIHQMSMAGKVARPMRLLSREGFRNL